MSSNDYKRMKSIDSIQTSASGTREVFLSEKEEIKCNNIIKQYKMVIFNDVTKENIKEHNPNLPQIPNHPYVISMEAQGM